MAKRKAAARSREPTFEEAMTRLEEIVKELEEAELPLEQSLKVFEEGVRLSRLLNGKLSEAEEKVEILLRDEEGKKVARPFNAGEEKPPGEGEEGEEDDDSDQGGLPF
jgi:exodeoxyribonuclease VII small subunit